ncbi:RDD family protein [Pseudomonas sp. G(2018)]|uniref:RDD family protein n=1 Tax=Pseudomonas sp. G(2018) TaxID=2502242 RepID=UPI0010F5755B|nr:RDD family protein [Pseudomonas sp. G(2018)]
MSARLAGEQPSPLSCVVRRCLAKAVDLTLFVSISFMVAFFVLPGSLRFDALVPAFLSVLWVLGFIVSADIAFVLVFGRTPGEMLAGIRVLTLEEERLGLSQRQDRTTDAFVDGTIGCISLLSLFWRREPAPYDKGCTVWFARLTRQRLLVTALISAALVTTLVVASVAIGFMGVQDSAPAIVIRLMKKVGFDVQERWVNPLTGKVLILPVGWRVLDSSYQPPFGELMVNFACTQDDGLCLVRLAISPDSILYSQPDEISNFEQLDGILRSLLNTDYDEGSLDLRPDVLGDPRFDLLYSARTVFNENAADLSGTAIVWFTERKHTWALGIAHSIAARPALRDEAYRLAFGLIQSTRMSQ